MSIEPLWGIELGFSKLIFFENIGLWYLLAAPKTKIPEISLVEHRQDGRHFTHLDHFVTRSFNVKYVIVLGTFVLSIIQIWGFNRPCSQCIKKSLFDLKWHWNDLGVILHLCHIKALSVIQLCAKFYEAASNGCLWGSTWNITLRFLLNKLMFQGYVFVGNLNKEEF